VLPLPHQAKPGKEPDAVVKKRLLECSFLISLRRDANLSDGRPHARKAWNWLEGQMLPFGGGTEAVEHYKGWYPDPDTGQRVRDVSKKYFVALAREEVGRLRSLLQEACGVFQQKRIYLSVAGYVKFVEGPKDETS
jgi:hypothetical protein